MGRRGNPYHPVSARCIDLRRTIQCPLEINSIKAKRVSLPDPIGITALIPLDTEGYFFALGIVDNVARKRGKHGYWI